MKLLAEIIPESPDDPSNEWKIMNYVKNILTRYKDFQISVTEGTQGAAPYSCEHCQNYYQFINDELLFICKEHCQNYYKFCMLWYKACFASSLVNTIVDLLKSMQQIVPFLDVKLQRCSFTTRI